MRKKSIPYLLAGLGNPEAAIQFHLEFNQPQSILAI
jgi:hypothetical protein